MNWKFNRNRKKNGVNNNSLKYNVLIIISLQKKKPYRTTVGFYLRPGRWYQVRVAAINAYGFRGYSEPSQAFTLPNRKYI